ncbi:MAG: hypothetical protein U1E05_10265 [Patescibacteria group bacterium]|nr:hypothetical protein [Patescibacteria group bacterium]
MSYRSTPRWIILLLLAGASILPATACVVLLLSALLGAMGDAAGAHVLVYVGWAVGVLWCVSLVSLVFALAVRALLAPEDGLERSSAERSRGQKEPDD